MSHFTTIQTQIRDLDALADACRELGLELINQPSQARGYAGNTRTGDAVIKLNGPYDVAANKQPDNSYGLTTDWWNGHVEKEVGKEYGRLLQLYGVYKASREARKRGYTVRRQSLKDGSIKLAIGGV
jgi:hypothetical protein